MEAGCSDYVILGRVMSAYGVKGWLKIFSYTDPIENILNYQPWLLRRENDWQELSFEQGKRTDNAIIVHFGGCDSRDDAATYRGTEIAIRSRQLPELMEGDYYWQQLVGLSVIDMKGELLGKVDHLIETGANDVLVVKGDRLSIDQRERLIPFIKDSVIADIDLAQGRIRVDWDSDF